MIRLDTLSQMSLYLPSAACEIMRGHVAEFPEHWDHTCIEHVSFTHLFDSPVMLIETVEELEHVRSFDDWNDKPLALLHGASEWFDIAEWQCDGAFAVFCAIESTNGGVQYYIPRHIAEQVPFVAQSIAMKAHHDAATARLLSSGDYL